MRTGRPAVSLVQRLILRGERQGRAKLNDDKVREIRRSFAAGGSRMALARRFGVSWPVIDGATSKEPEHGE